MIQTNEYEVETFSVIFSRLLGQSLLEKLFLGKHSVNLTRKQISIKKIDSISILDLYNFSKFAAAKRRGRL